MSSSSRILFIQPKLNGIGGIERVVPVVAEELSSHGYEVHAISFYDSVSSKNGIWKTWAQLGEKEAHGILAKIKKTVSRIRFVVRTIRSISPSFIIVSAQGTTIQLLLAKTLRLIRAPILVYVHQSLTEHEKGHSFLASLLYNNADGYIGVSDSVVHEIRELVQGRIPVVRVYNPVPAESSIKTVSFEKELLSGEHPRLITASRIETIKGVDVLVELASQYFAANKGSLHILGDGSLEHILRARVEELGMHDRIRFYGARADARLCMREADVYVSCARAEAFGVAIVEALAAGKPVILTDISGGPREIMTVSEEIREYPHKTPYGFLLHQPISLDAKEAAQEIHHEFTIAVRNSVSGIFMPETLRARADDFLPQKVLQPLFVFLKQYTHHI